MTPDGRLESDYRKAYYDTLKALLHRWQSVPAPERIIFVSSTSVYGQNAGERVDEFSVAEPATPRAKVLKQAEQLLPSSGQRYSVVRFSGIYGPGRDYLLRQVWAGKGGDNHYTNRIHSEDCSAVLCHLLDLLPERLARLYLASDKLPVPGLVIRQWLARQLGIEPGTLNTAASDGRGANKRCDSARLEQSGYRFQYPTYKEGYPNLIAEFLKTHKEGLNK